MSFHFSKEMTWMINIQLMGFLLLTSCCFLLSLSGSLSCSKTHTHTLSLFLFCTCVSKLTHTHSWLCVRECVLFSFSWLWQHVKITLGRKSSWWGTTNERSSFFHWLQEKCFCFGSNKFLSTWDWIKSCDSVSMYRLQTIATLVRLANTGWHLEANFGCLLKAKCAKALMVNSYVIISHGTRESYFKRLITN